jgi:hypothetical protein
MRAKISEPASNIINAVDGVRTQLCGHGRETNYQTVAAYINVKPFIPIWLDRFCVDGARTKLTFFGRDSEEFDPLTRCYGPTLSRG